MEQRLHDTVYDFANLLIVYLTTSGICDHAGTNALNES